MWSPRLGWRLLSGPRTPVVCNDASCLLQVLRFSRGAKPEEKEREREAQGKREAQSVPRRWWHKARWGAALPPACVWETVSLPPLGPPRSLLPAGSFRACLSFRPLVFHSPKISGCGLACHWSFPTPHVFVGPEYLWLVTATLTARLLTAHPLSWRAVVCKM